MAAPLGVVNRTTETWWWLCSGELLRCVFMSWEDRFSEQLPEQFLTLVRVKEPIHQQVPFFKLLTWKDGFPVRHSSRFPMSSLLFSS